MTDISKCNNEECLNKNKCYRYTAPADEYQCYGDFKLIDGMCDAYWNNEDRKVKSLDA